MTQCKEGAQREGLMLDSNEELYKWFTGQVMRNLHVVFTMNPSSEGLKDRAATSPALFNRCVLNWFGDWSDGALFQVCLFCDCDSLCLIVELSGCKSVCGLVVCNCLMETDKTKLFLLQSHLQMLNPAPPHCVHVSL
jgi:hypothetical protein